MGKIRLPISKQNSSAKKSLKKDSSTKKDIKKKSHIIKISTPISRINRKIISKKEKKKIKKDKVLNGILQTKKKFQEEKATKKRQKTAIVGDLRPLLDSLPSLESLIEIRDKSKKTGISTIDKRTPRKQRKPRNKFEKKKILIHEKTEKFLDRHDHLQKMWKDPDFQKNPRELIAERIKRSRNENEMEN